MFISTLLLQHYALLVKAKHIRNHLYTLYFSYFIISLKNAKEINQVIKGHCEVKVPRLELVTLSGVTYNILSL